MPWAPRLGTTILATGVLLGACARQSAPPGGPQDRRPPVIVATSPENLGVMERLDGEVEFSFDERISERVSGGALETAISVSPRGGALSVDHGSRSLSVRVEGGFQPGLVYRVTLAPVVSDLFGNRMADPFELVFSTGGDPVPTTIAGEVWNRTSGQPAGQATVFAVSADELIHQATADQRGIFAFRYLPGGSFEVTAFEDLNRNAEVDSAEVQGVVTAELNPGDTVLVDVAILPPDTSAAVVSGAEPLDSITVVVEFDDFLDTDQAAEEWGVRISGVDGQTPGTARLFQEFGYAAYLEEVADSLARLDSIAAEEAGRIADSLAALAAAVADSQSAETAQDSLAGTPDSLPSEVADSALADSLAAGAPGLQPPDTAVLGPRPASGTPGLAPSRPRGPPRLDPLQGSRPGPTADGRRVLPGRRVVVLLDDPLERDVEYEIELTDVTNINGLTGGGGATTLILAAPPPDTSAVGDTLVTDSAAVVDTGGVGVP